MSRTRTGSGKRTGARRWLALVALALSAGTGLAADYRDWNGARVAFLGDSITDRRHIGCATNYWGFLAERMGIRAFVYGLNGNQMSDIPKQVEQAKAELGDDVDAVFIFAGSNDYNANVPLGAFFSEAEVAVRKNAATNTLRQRTLLTGDGTFCGRLNAALGKVKTAFPQAQVVLLTPIHRGFAQFGASNVQPDEAHANTCERYIDDYVQAVRRAGAIWSVPVIDLYAECGILPTLPEYDAYVANPVRDRLHPSTIGHERLARVLEMRLRAMPSTFRR
ncbi:MAG: SGNH/GDSL hydrolase family protein [Kiritimatiellia bacterium]